MRLPGELIMSALHPSVNYLCKLRRHTYIAALPPFPPLPIQAYTPGICHRPPQCLAHLRFPDHFQHTLPRRHAGTPDKSLKRYVHHATGSHHRFVGARSDDSGSKGEPIPKMTDHTDEALLKQRQQPREEKRAKARSSCHW